MTLNYLINHHVKFRSNKTAVVFDDQPYTWKDFAGLCNQLSNALLTAGIKKGDKVATILPNSLELITLYWATTQIGAVVVPLSPLLQAQGVISLVNSSGSRMIFTTQEIQIELAQHLDGLHNIASEDVVIVDKDSEANSYANFIASALRSFPEDAKVSPDDLFNIIYSSGTTGSPKGIEHSHQVRLNYCYCFASSFRMTPESVVLHTGSIVFNGAFVDLMPCFYLGATYILHKAFDAEAMITAVAKFKVTHTVMVPAQIIALLESPNATIENLKSLEMILTIGAPLPLENKQQLIKLLPNRFYELYGLTEGFVTILDKNDAEKKHGSVGSPPTGFKMRIVDDKGEDVPKGEIGEIIGDGPIRMNGYHGRADLTADTIRDGWIYTGDLGYEDEDGFLYLSGRKKDLIVSGGVNVYPSDIEDVISRHESVSEVAVFGVESGKWGEAPVAAVILKKEFLVKEGIQKEVLIDWVNQRVEAKFQRISDLMFHTSFPRNAAGKTLKNELQEIYREYCR